MKILGLFFIEYDSLILKKGPKNAFLGTICHFFLTNSRFPNKEASAQNVVKIRFRPYTFIIGGLQFFADRKQSMLAESFTDLMSLILVEWLS